MWPHLHIHQENSSRKPGIPSGEVVKMYPNKFSRAVSKKDE